jgi:hypothetical protein
MFTILSFILNFTIIFYYNIKNITNNFAICDHIIIYIKLSILLYYNLENITNKIAICDHIINLAQNYTIIFYYNIKNIINNFAYLPYYNLYQTIQSYFIIIKRILQIILHVYHIIIFIKLYNHLFL